MKDLDRGARLHLMKFVCTFAWTDLRVTESERTLVEELAEQLGMDDAEREEVRGWLRSPPPPDEVDPTDIPPAHRQAFYAAAKAMVEADGRVVPGEQDSLELFRELLHE